MTDSYEEEHQARFVELIKALLTVLAGVHEDLVAALRTGDRDEHTFRYDRAMNLLFNTFNLSHPVAQARQKNSGMAFMWIDDSDKT